MRLNLDEDLPLGRPIAESDPLPPPDRAPPVAAGRIELLYRKHRHKLLHFVGRHGRADQAPDIVQHVFALLTAQANGGAGDRYARRLSSPGHTQPAAQRGAGSGTPIGKPQSREAYERFGLNDRQIELISRATPKRHYYLQSARGNRLFELGLGPIALALCGASDPASQTMIESLLANGGAGDFAARFLAVAGHPWAALPLAEAPLARE